MNILIDYKIADQCENKDAWYICHKCGKCGRIFKNGIMVDDGDTTVSEERRMITKVEWKALCKINGKWCAFSEVEGMTTEQANAYIKCMPYFVPDEFAEKITEEGADEV